MIRKAIVLGLLALAPLSGGTATAPAVPAGCDAPEYRQLDSWLGDWDAFDRGNDAMPSARAHIDRIAGGCAVHELYDQTDGLIGDSILSFDPVRRVWQQTWVTNRGSLMVIAGRMIDGALTLEGEMHIRDGRSLQQRITWKAEGAGVREASVVSKDGGKTWTPAFDVLFRKHHQ
jgi:hypothetical protein